MPVRFVKVTDRVTAACYGWRKKKRRSPIEIFGIRKTHTEKLQSELSDIRAAIAQYESSLDTLRSREKEIISEIELERFKEVSELLKQKGMTLCDLKEMLAAEPV